MTVHWTVFSLRSACYLPRNYQISNVFPFNFILLSYPFEYCKFSPLCQIFNRFHGCCRFSVNNWTIAHLAMSKKLLLLGASGQTGQEVIKQGLERGHHVIALVSFISCLTLRSAKSTVSFSRFLCSTEYCRPFYFRTFIRTRIWKCNIQLLLKHEVYTNLFIMSIVKAFVL